MNVSKLYFGILIIFIFSLISVSTLQAQSNFGAGFDLGGGTIGGNLTSQDGFATALFIEGNPGFNSDLIMRLSFIYVLDINVLFPKNSSRNYPFIKGFSLKGIISQNLSGSIYLEEGLGILTLNDRTFNNLNEWDLGAAFSIMPGIDLRDEMKKGFKLGVGTEYGLTFTNTNVWYLSIHFQTEYYF